jgi:hypothetical protein
MAKAERIRAVVTLLPVTLSSEKARISHKVPVANDLNKGVAG